MTTERRVQITPTIDLRALSTGLTARASHASTLAELVNDATAGHPRQRWAITRAALGTYHGFYRRSLARYLVVRAAIRAYYNTYGATITLALTITDGTNTVSASPKIPDGLRADVDHQSNAGADSGTTDTTISHQEWTLDVDAIAGVLTASSDWRFVLVVASASGTPPWLENFTVEELPRWLVDTADAYGQLPHDYVARGLVVDGASGLTRLQSTLRLAYTEGLRTYHAMSRPEANPWSTTSATYAGMNNDLEPGSVPMAWQTRGRKMRGTADCRVRFRVRYKTSGATDGYLRLTTTAGAYALTLAATSGAWADSGYTDAYLKTSSSDCLDVMYFEAKIASGTVSISARTVIDKPT